MLSFNTIWSTVPGIRKFLGLPDPEPQLIVHIQIPTALVLDSSNKSKVIKKNLYFAVFLLHNSLFSVMIDVNVPTVNIRQNKPVDQDPDPYQNVTDPED